MEIIDALKVIQQNYKVAFQDWDDITDEYQEQQVLALKLAINALEKQIPKKAIPVKEGSVWTKCPVCGDTYIDEYCGKCGQRLDWSDENDL